MPATGTKRGNASEPAPPAVIDIDIGDVHHVVARAVPAIPRVEPVTRPNRQPADETKPEPAADANAAAETEEGHIRGCPHRPISRISVGRPGPPYPRAVVNEPASVVIRSPAPGFIRNPRPTPSRLPHPASAAIGRPTRAHYRRPYRTIVRHCHPASVSIKVF